MHRLTICLLLILCTGCLSAPINPPNFFIGLEPFMKSKVSQASVVGPGSIVHDQSATTTNKNDDLNDQITSSLKQLLGVFEKNKKDTKTKTQETLKKKETDEIDQEETKKSVLKDQTKELLDKIYEVVQTNKKDLTNEDVKNTQNPFSVPHDNLHDQTKDLIEKLFDSSDKTKKNEETTKDTAVVENKRNWHDETSKDTVETSSKKTTLKDLKQAVANLVEALESNESPAKDQVSDLENLKINKVEEEEKKEVEKEHSSEGKKVSYSELQTALDSLVKSLDKKDQHKELMEAESRMGNRVSMHMTAKDDKPVVKVRPDDKVRPDAPGPGRLIQIGDQKQQKDFSSLEELYEELKRATAEEEMKRKREAKKHELVGLLNELLGPTNQIVYDGKQVAMKKDEKIADDIDQNNVKKAKNDILVQKKESDVQQKDANSVEARESLVNYLLDFVKQYKQKRSVEASDDLSGFEKAEKRP